MPSKVASIRFGCACARVIATYNNRNSSPSNCRRCRCAASQCGHVGCFAPLAATARAVDLLASGAVRVGGLISHPVELQDYLEVFRLFGGPDTMKLMVRMD